MRPEAVIVANFDCETRTGEECVFSCDVRCTFLDEVQDCLAETVSLRLHRGSLGPGGTHLCLKGDALTTLIRNILGVRATFRVEGIESCHETCM